MMFQHQVPHRQNGHELTHSSTALAAEEESEDEELLLRDQGGVPP